MDNSLLRLRILIVDDIPEHAARLSQKIQHLDHEVVLLSNPEEAVRLVQSAENLYNPVDVAILDYFLPGMDGVELGKQLKAADPDLSIIILTSDGSMETSKSVLASGLESIGFITKKEDISILISALNYMLVNKELRLSGEKSFLKERTNSYNGKKLEME